MKANLNETINFLKEQIKSNLDEIKKNESKLKEILYVKKENSNYAATQIFEQNKNLLMQNFDILNLQLSLLKVVNTVNFDRKGPSKPINVNSKINYIDFFKETIEGNLVYDHNHPLYNDKVFFEKLLSFFMQTENFEMCASLLEHKKNNLDLQ